MSAKAKFIFVISFGLNLVLAAAFWMNRSTSPVRTNEVATTKSAPGNRSSKRSQRQTQTLVVTNETPLDWRTVESSDYLEYIRNLRSIGCPEETVRDIIIADVNKLYASKEAALYPSPKEMKFWRVDDRLAKREQKERDYQRQQMEKQKRELIKQLLGIDYESAVAEWSGRPNEDAFRYGFLPPELQEQAKSLHDKYREMQRALFSDGGMTPENRAKFMSLRAEQEAEMAKLLGPENFQEYQLRNSYTARNMRENLTSFQPSEDEFRQIFELQKTFDDQFGLTRGNTDEATREQRKLAQQQLEQNLKSALGEERFQAYQLSQDERYRESYDFAQRYDLPQQTADAIYQVRLAAEQERNRIRNDPTLDANARAQAYAALARDTGNALQPVIGTDNWDRFRTRSDWFTRLNPSARDDSRNRNRYSRERGGR